MKRNGYTTISKELAKLKLNEIWVYSILKSYRKKEGFTDLTLEQIECLSGVSNIERIIPKLKPYLLKIEQKKLDSYRMQNLYYFKKEESFVYLDNRFFEVQDIKDVKTKAFLIKLKLLCISGTNHCNFDKKEIAKRLNMSRPTLDKYISLAVDSGELAITKEGFEIKNEYIIKDYIKSGVIKNAEKYLKEKVTADIKGRANYVIKNADSWNMDKLHTEIFIIDGIKPKKKHRLPITFEL